MLNSAKGIVTRRALARFDGLHDSSAQSKEDEKKKQESSSNGKSFLERGRDFWNTYADVAQFTRNMNNIARSKGEEIPFDMVGSGIVNSVGGAIQKALGISDSTAKRMDDALVTSIDSAIRGSSIIEAVENGVQTLSQSTPQYGASAKPVIYSDWSPASRLFGMSQDIAFSEHMANTAHQREVADLKAAGLNPVLGVSGSGATSVSGNAGGGSSSAMKAADNGFLDVLGATAAVITAVATKNPMYGYMVSNIFKAFD